MMRPAATLRRLLAQGGLAARTIEAMERRRDQVAALDRPIESLGPRADVLGPLARGLDGWHTNRRMIDRQLGKLASNGTVAAATGEPSVRAPWPPARPSGRAAACGGGAAEASRPRAAKAAARSDGDAIDDRGKARIGAMLADAATGEETVAAVPRGASHRARDAALAARADGATALTARASTDLLATSPGEWWPRDAARGAASVSADAARARLAARAARAGASSSWITAVSRARGAAGAELPARLTVVQDEGGTGARVAVPAQAPPEGAGAATLANLLERLQPRPPSRAVPATAERPPAGQQTPEGADAAARAVQESRGLRRLLVLAPEITGQPASVRARGAGRQSDTSEAPTSPALDRDRPALAPLGTERTLPSLLVERLQDERLADRLDRILRAEARRQGVDLDGVAS